MISKVSKYPCIQRKWISMYPSIHVSKYAWYPSIQLSKYPKKISIQDIHVSGYQKKVVSTHPYFLMYCFLWINKFVLQIFPNEAKAVHGKGQLISKCLFCVFNSSKKTNLKIQIFALASWGRNSPFIFLEELNKPKMYFWN